MGKALIIKGGNFGLNAVYSGSGYIYVDNTFTWGKGGINRPGESSGATNPAMSMVGLPLEYASEELTFFGANGYKISAFLTSDLSSPSTSPAGQYSYTQYTTPVDSLTIPSGKYYEISVIREDGNNADLSDGPSALLLRQEVS